ncbi:uncharacterized protein [Apostichopus japonicus]|uniref:uncharacterized protein isoform X2 n=1 Tax=Stichopus japonicus TaxID=307972 RepID=UPI003AB64241
MHSPCHTVMHTPVYYIICILNSIVYSSIIIMGIMPIIVLLLLGSISSNVHAEITKSPSSGIYLEGSDVTLTCVVEGNDNVVWDDLNYATSIFIGKDKNTDKKKYDNFEISSVVEDFSLIIKDFQLSDEGTYVCKDRDRLANATVTIGVLPYVYLSVKQTEATQAPHTSTEVNITCSAYNARPAVSVFELSVIGSEKTVNITNDKSNQNEDGNTYNSSASVSYIMSSEEMSVYCRVFTAGRSLSHTENFYKPRCNITISGNEIRCLCQANPQVNTYYIDVNGNNHDGDVLFIEEDDPMNIRCFATNELGTGQSDILFPDDINGFGIVPVAVIVSVVVLLVVLTVIFIICRRGPREKKSDEEQPTEQHCANKEESVNLLPQSEHIPPGNEEKQPTLHGAKKEENVNQPSQSDHIPPGNEEEQLTVQGAKEEESVNIPSHSHITPGNEEMSDRKNTNDEEASRLSPKLESSFPKTDLTSDLKDPQKFISKILLQVNKDWEIFAIEILNISEKVVKEAVMKNNNLEDQINAATKNMTSYHIEVLDENAELCEEFGFEYVKREKGCFLLHINNTQADLILEASQENDPTNISSSDDILVSCGFRIGKIGIKKLLEAFGKTCIGSADGATILKTLEQTNVIGKPYVNLLRQLTNCKIYGARKILLFYIEKDLQQLKATIRNHVKNDWEIFAIEILDIPEKLVEDAVINYDTYEDHIEVVIRKITAEHIDMMNDIKTHNKLKKKNKLSEFNLQSVEKEGRYYFRNLESTQSEKSPNEEKICQKDPPTIESRDCMLKLCRERIGKVGIRRLLAALKTGNIETKDETNILKKLYEHGVINKNCANLLSKLSDCKLFRARKIVIAYLEADLWNYITNSICPQISVDWEIFAVDVLGLENCYVVEIIEHTKDEKEQVLSMFRKWRYMYGQRKEVSNQILQDLIYAKNISSKIMSKDNRPKDNTALKVKPINEGGCSKDFLAMLTNCSKRIGVAGSKRFAEINSQGGIRKFLVATGVVGASAEAPEGISVDDSVDSLGQLCSMLSKANLFTARDVVITYIEKKLKDVITQISKKRASTWDKLAWYGLSLSNEDVVHIERAEKSNEERVRMAISKWMRKTEICEDVQQTLMKKAQITFPDLGI